MNNKTYTQDTLPETVVAELREQFGDIEFNDGFDNLDEVRTYTILHIEPGDFGDPVSLIEPVNFTSVTATGETHVWATKFLFRVSGSQVHFIQSGTYPYPRPAE